ncbi:hypothetical protein TSUD_58420 [Trifolium subterraneum]|uniref:HTH myb-type domain-containing protein n=1 Tax=Trifolium subterraneum TaxID=3900 RepID=A0A2Z6N6T7_TRISU|nr:hypothetical protein TSUD_58420 [Trifolium subterraneum]
MACVLQTKNNRVSWQSPELQQLFLRVVNQLGIHKATPKKITELMDVPGLETKHVASHLQRFRLGLKSSRKKTKSKSGRGKSKEDQYHVPNESLEVGESMPKQDQYHVPNSGMEQQVSRNINGFSPDNGDDCLCTEYNDNRIGGQFHLINGEASGRVIELAQSLNTSRMVLKEHFEPRATLGTSLRHCQSFDQQSSISILPLDHFIYFSRHSDMVCAGNRNWSPTPQDDEVFNDQVSQHSKLDFWEELPTKKRRLMHFPGGCDGILTSFLPSCDFE